MLAALGGGNEGNIALTKVLHNLSRGHRIRRWAGVEAFLVQAVHALFKLKKAVFELILQKIGRVHAASMPRSSPIRFNHGMAPDWTASAQAWIDFVDAGDPSRVHLMDPEMLRQAEPIAGSRVLDAGCGEGRFSRMLAKRGAHVIGIDPVLPLLHRAIFRDPSTRCARAGAEAIPMVANTFDIVVSYLTLIDIRDFRTGIREMVRVLRPGGRLLVANLNPFVTTRPEGWETDEQGRRLYVPVDHYFEERANRTTWRNIDVINHHRPMSAYMQAFLSAKLRLIDFMEPKPTPEQIAAEPSLDSGRRVPFFHVMSWEKPS